jgi:hypothetical protein
MRIQVAVHVDHPGEVGRPRWSGRLQFERRELTVAIGDLVLVFSEPAARCLLEMLAVIMPSEEEPGPRVI